MFPQMEAAGRIVERLGIDETYIQARYQHPGSYQYFSEMTGGDREAYKKELDEYQARASGAMGAANKIVTGLTQLTPNQLLQLENIQSRNPRRLMNLTGSARSPKELDAGPFLKELQERMALSNIEKAYPVGGMFSDSYTSLLSNTTYGGETEATSAQEAIARLSRVLTSEGTGFTAKEVTSRIDALKNLAKFNPREVLKAEFDIENSLGSMQQGTIEYGKEVQKLFGAGGQFSPNYIEAGIASAKQAQKPVAAPTMTTDQMLKSGNIATQVKGMKQKYLESLSDSEKLLRSDELERITTPFGFNKYKEAADQLAPGEQMSRESMANIEYQQQKHSSDEFQRMGWLEATQRFATYSTTEGFKRGAMNLLANGLMGKLPVGAMPAAIGIAGLAAMVEGTRLSNESALASQYTRGELGIGGFYGTALNMGISPEMLKSSFQIASATGIKDSRFGIQIAGASASGLSPTQIGQIVNPFISGGMSAKNAYSLVSMLGANGFAGASYLGTMQNAFGAGTDMGTILGQYNGTYGPNGNPALQGVLSNVAGNPSNWMMYAAFSGDFTGTLEAAYKGDYSKLAAGAKSWFNAIGHNPVIAAGMGLTPKDYQALAAGGSPDQIRKALGMLSPEETRSQLISQSVQSSLHEAQRAETNPLTFMWQAITHRNVGNDIVEGVLNDPSLANTKLTQQDILNNLSGHYKSMSDFAMNGWHGLSAELDRHNQQAVNVNVTYANPQAGKPQMQTVGRSTQSSGPTSTNSSQDVTGKT